MNDSQLLDLVESKIATGNNNGQGFDLHLDRATAQLRAAVCMSSSTWNRRTFDFRRIRMLYGLSKKMWRRKQMKRLFCFPQRWISTFPKYLSLLWGKTMNESQLLDLIDNKLHINNGRGFDLVLERATAECHGRLLYVVVRPEPAMIKLSAYMNALAPIEDQIEQETQERVSFMPALPD